MKGAWVSGVVLASLVVGVVAGYHLRPKCGEIPESHSDVILDTLSSYDDIQLERIADVESKIDSVHQSIIQINETGYNELESRHNRRDSLPYVDSDLVSRVRIFANRFPSTFHTGGGG